MRRTISTVLGLLSLIAGLGAPIGASAQGFSANYSLHVPELRISAPASGLSLEAGQKWFARVGVGSSIVDQERLSVGGGYRFPDGQAVSVQLVRGLGQDRMGLAVRYDWASNYYLRVSYDRRWGEALTSSQPDMLRFSAGIRF
ncbi:hypothetical protein [Ramlibacter albus]|uniref:Uncharacterized protein n=1 Tax=Ramlibacter albus TaxID=2079448 RepID=A0A923MAY2_9BURK|nr:hypothetical protein [Ramlibacter albus]MBC5766645.1 hypothetical protein [Ramlibacter albus]